VQQLNPRCRRLTAAAGFGAVDFARKKVAAGRGSGEGKTIWSAHGKVAPSLSIQAEKIAEKVATAS